MNRREFIAGLGSAAAWPLTARAQQRQVPLIGFLSTPSTAPLDAAFQQGLGEQGAAFQQGLGEQGYIDGQNVEILFRFGRYDRMPALVEELVRRPVSVIVASRQQPHGRNLPHSGADRQASRAAARNRARNHIGRFAR
jgi:putative tryptophan/tyrosine transport system substrate-binding protein